MHPDKVCDHIPDAVLDAFLHEALQAAYRGGSFCHGQPHRDQWQVGLSDQSKLKDDICQIKQIGRDGEPRDCKR